MKRTLLLTTILALTLAACAEPSDQAAIDPTETDWVLQSGTVDGNPVPVLDTHPITLGFLAEERAGGTSACNQYSGPYTISAPDFSFGDMTSTLMACDPEEVMDSESAYLDAIGRVDAFSATEERLTLSGDGVELIFVPAQ